MMRAMTLRRTTKTIAVLRFGCLTINTNGRPTRSTGKRRLRKLSEAVPAGVCSLK